MTTNVTSFCEQYSEETNVAGSVRGLQLNRMQRSSQFPWIDCYTGALPRHHTRPYRVGPTDLTATPTALVVNLPQPPCWNYHSLLQEKKQTNLISIYPPPEYLVAVLRPTRHKIGDSGNVLPKPISWLITEETKSNTTKANIHFVTQRDHNTK